MGMDLTPIDLKTAKAFVDEHHRHNSAPVGHKFSIGLQADGQLIGVCIVGRPISRVNDDGETAEIYRVCVLAGYKNANSKLYGAAVRACRAMGYKRILTYTLPTESGASLRAVGFVLDGVTKPSWDGWSRPGKEKKPPGKYPGGRKLRWSLLCGGG